MLFQILLTPIVSSLKETSNVEPLHINVNNLNLN